MKNVFFVMSLLLCLHTFAQQGTAFGLKGGLNYNSNGDFTSEVQVQNATKSVGFHLGVYGKLDAGPIYIRPELVYTRTSSEYKVENLIISKLDVPVLVGLDISGPLSVFAGPDFQYILSNDFGSVSIEDPENQCTVGAQFGLALNFEFFGIDIRYERGLSENEALLTGVPGSRIDTRPDQIILGLSVKL
ncbi:outer membrane beta-barrel protein [Patiriisocius sp. Uisw_047]|uniref:outer membrane beta-barrel protein n=1 Tax=Patiriisocius sp. Uisw_047 TaxID=3230969 RepID=UPI0039ED8E98